MKQNSKNNDYNEINERFKKLMCAYSVEMFKHVNDYLNSDHEAIKRMETLFTKLYNDGEIEELFVCIQAISRVMDIPLPKEIDNMPVHSQKLQDAIYAFLLDFKGVLKEHAEYAEEHAEEFACYDAEYEAWIESKFEDDLEELLDEN